MKKKYILLLLGLSSSIFARESCYLDLLSSDEKVNIDGQCSLPIFNTGFMARGGYLQNEYSKLKPINKYVDNTIGTKIQNIFGSIYYSDKINDSNLVYSLGGRYSYYSLDKRELLTDKRDGFILDSDININIQKISFTGGIQYLNDNLALNVKYIYSPKKFTSVKTKQDSKETPKLKNSNGKLEDEPKFESSSLIESNIELFTSKLGKHFPNTILEYSIGKIPYLYQQKVLNENETSYIKEMQEYDETIQKYGIKFGWKTINNIMFTIGCKLTKIKTNEILEDGKKITDKKELEPEYSLGIRYLW